MNVLGAIFILTGMLLPCVYAEDIPQEEIPILESVLAKIWGGRSWDSPASNPEEAVLIFDEALEAVMSDASKATIWELRADYFRVMGNQVESMRASKLIYESFPTSSRALNAANELVDGARKLGDFTGLLKTAVEQIEKTNDTTKIIHLTNEIAFARFKLGEADAALAEMLSLLDRFPEHSEEILLNLHNLGVGAISSGDYVFARNALQKVYSQTAPKRRSSHLLANLANIALLTGRREEAVKFHLESLERFPNDPRRISHEFSLGVLLFDLENLQRAKNHFQAVIHSPAQFEGVEKYREVARTSLREIEAKLNPVITPLTKNVEASNRLPWLLFLNGTVFVVVALVMLRKLYQK